MTAVGTDGNTRLDIGAAGFSANSSIPNALTLLPNGNVGIGTTSPSARLQVVNATCNGSSWINASDRNLKENFEDVNTRDVLKQVTKLPVKRWSYKAHPGQGHIGPMAQDFHAAFGVAADDKHIATVDADGVAFAAIQGLHQIVKEQEAELQAKEKKIGSLEKRLEVLEKLVKSLLP